MPRVPKSRFVNRVALRKAIRNFSANDLKVIIDPIYSKKAKKMKNTAKSNANKTTKSGKLRNNIGTQKHIKAGARSGRLATWSIYSRSIQDMVIHNGIPDATLSGPQATARSRTINGVKHRLKAGYNYTKAKQKTKTGKVAKKLPIGKDGRPWAFGKRRANEFMTDNQVIQPDLANMATSIGNGIRLEIANAFRKNIKASFR